MTNITAQMPIMIELAPVGTGKGNLFWAWVLDCFNLAIPPYEGEYKGVPSTITINLHLILQNINKLDFQAKPEDDAPIHVINQQ